MENLEDILKYCHSACSLHSRQPLHVRAAMQDVCGMGQDQGWRPSAAARAPVSCIEPGACSADPRPHGTKRTLS